MNSEESFRCLLVSCLLLISIYLFFLASFFFFVSCLKHFSFAKSQQLWKFSLTTVFRWYGTGNGSKQYFKPFPLYFFFFVVLQFELEEIRNPWNVQLFFFFFLALGIKSLNLQWVLVFLGLLTMHHLSSFPPPLFFFFL